MSPSLISQNRTKSGLAISLSTSLARLSGSVSARNSRIWSGGGCSPVRSSVALRRNAASLDDGRGGTGRDPVAEQEVLVGVGRDALAAAVWRAPGRFAQEEAHVRSHRREPAPAGLVRERAVVALGVVPEDRKVEAVLAVGLAVAAARI